MSGKTECMQLLVSLGSSVAERCYCEFSSVLTAAAFYQQESLRWLLANGASLAEMARFNHTVLHMACTSEKPRFVEWLLQQPNCPAVTDVTTFGGSPLHMARVNDCAQVQQLLIAHGANPAAVNNFGATPDDDFAVMCAIVNRQRSRLLEVLQRLTGVSSQPSLLCLTFR